MHLKVFIRRKYFIFGQIVQVEEVQQLSLLFLHHVIISIKNSYLARLEGVLDIKISFNMTIILY